jgi:ABC-type xylose transport system permease subunit
VIRAIFQVRSCVLYKYRDRDLRERARAESRPANSTYIRRISKVPLTERDHVVVNSVSDSGVGVVVCVIIVTVLKGIVYKVLKKKKRFKLVLKSFSYKYV